MRSISIQSHCFSSVPQWYSLESVQLLTNNSIQMLYKSVYLNFSETMEIMKMKRGSINHLIRLQNFNICKGQ